MEQLPEGIESRWLEPPNEKECQYCVCSEENIDLRCRCGCHLSLEDLEYMRSEALFEIDRDKSLE